MKNITLGLAALLLTIVFGACDNKHSADVSTENGAELVQEISIDVERLAGTWEMKANDASYVCSIKADGSGNLFKHLYDRVEKAAFTLVRTDDGDFTINSDESVARGWRVICTTDDDFLVIERENEFYALKRKK